MDGIKTQINTNKSSNIEFHTKTQQSQQKIASKNPLERNPERDKFEKREKTKFIAFGTIAALAIAAGIEFFAFKGKHFDDIVSKFKNKKPKEPPKTEPPKTGETPKVETPKTEPPKTGETPKVETPKTSKKVRVEKPEPPKLLQGIDRTQYPKRYMLDGFEVEEIIYTISSSGDEYLCKNFYKDGELAIKEFSHLGSTRTSSKLFYENGVEVKNIFYKDDGITMCREKIFNINGNEIECRYYDKTGQKIVRVEKPEPPKLLQGIDRTQYPKRYMLDGFEVEEIIYTISSSGDEYLCKNFYKDGELAIKEFSHLGSTRTSSKLFYENGVEVKNIFYKDDGITMCREKIFDINGKEIECRYYD